MERKLLQKYLHCIIHRSNSKDYWKEVRIYTYESVSIIDEATVDPPTLSSLRQSFVVLGEASRHTRVCRPKWFRPDDRFSKLENASTLPPGNNYLLQASHEVRATPRWNRYRYTYVQPSVKCRARSCVSVCPDIKLVPSASQATRQIGDKVLINILEDVS
jgi:hypothetical protein